MKIFQISALTAMIAATIGLTGCTTDQITLSLEAAANAAVAVTPAIEAAANVPPETRAQIGSYLAVVQACLTTASVTLRTAGLTPAQQALAITSSCSEVLAQSPSLPAGTPVNVVAAVSAVAIAVNVFVSLFESQQPPALASAARIAKTPKVSQSTLNQIDAALALLAQQVAELH